MTEEDIENILNLPLTPEEKVAEISESSEETEKKEREEKKAIWGVKKRNELRDELLRDIYRKLAEIYLLNLLNSSPVVRDRVKQIANELKMVELLMR